MDFAALERAVYGEQVEDDEELLAELLALEAETLAETAASQPARAPVAPAPVAPAPAVPNPIARAPTAPALPVRAPAASLPVAPAPVAPAPRSVPPLPARTAPLPPENRSKAPAQKISPPVNTEERKKAEIRKVLIRRRNAYVENGKAAVACDDKTAAMQYVEVSKMFDEALKLLETASADDLDLNEAPPSPQPYKRKVVPKTFVDGLQYRRELYVAMVEKAKNAGDQRKTRMYSRSVAEYDEAIELAKRGEAVNISELPSLPNMAPLPPQKSSQTQPPKPTGPSPSKVTAPNTSPSPKPVAGPPAGIKPPPAVGPLAASGEAGKSRNQTQLEFLLTRQNQFKQAAIAAKKSGNTEAAREYLIESKGFEKMINRAKAGLPVTIRDTPIPPQAQTGQASLQPRIVATNNSVTGLEGRGEVLAMLESTLIEQIKFAETNRMRFTRLGDVGKVNMFENWAKLSKTDLLLVREVAKQGLQIPGFRYEIRDIPTADLFPDLAEDVLELTIAECRDVPLPSGYETKHASLFVKYCFPYPTETPQTGKTKTVNDTVCPVFDEKLMIQIGERRARGQRLLRSLKRAALKLEVYQKGSFLRSDKLLGVCEFKLDVLEGKAEVEESAPLKEGRKAVGGLISFKVRIREPLGDTKVLVAKQKWLILLN